MIQSPKDIVDVVRNDADLNQAYAHNERFRNLVDRACQAKDARDCLYIFLYVLKELTAD